MGLGLGASSSSKGNSWTGFNAGDADEGLGGEALSLYAVVGLQPSCVEI